MKKNYFEKFNNKLIKLNFLKFILYFNKIILYNNYLN